MLFLQLDTFVGIADVVCARNNRKQGWTQFADSGRTEQDQFSDVYGGLGKLTDEGTQGQSQSISPTTGKQIQDPKT